MFYIDKKCLYLVLFLLVFTIKAEAALWTPADISTALWLDASDAATITLNATNTVSQWNDKSGNGRNVTQNTLTNQPYYHSTSKYDKWNNIAVSSPRGVAVSRDGNYIAYGAVSSNLFISSDRGDTWTTRLTDQARTIRHIAMSNDGQYISVSPDSTGGHLCSDDYGVSWTVRGDNTRFPGAVVMSSNGAIRLAAWTVSGLTGNTVPEISTDYGVTWTPVSGFASPSNYRFGMSASGQYMIIVNVTTSTIYNSSDYGTNWNSVAMVGGSPTASPIAISDSGQYISYGVFSASIRQSNDFGATWSTDTSAGTGRWFHLAMSADGSIRIATKDTGSEVWISLDYGNTYYPVYDGNLGGFRIAMSADGSVMAKTGTSVSIYNTSQIDKGSIYFNGSSSYLNLPTGILNNLSELTVAFVMRAPSGQTSKGIFGMSSGNGQGLELYFAPTTTVRINNVANASSTNAYWSNDSSLSMTTMTDSATALNIWENGTSELSTTGNAALNFNGVNTLGRYNSNAYANMTMSEFVIASSSLSTSDRQKLEGYLAWKWGTVTSLPNDHPYKSAAPLIWQVPDVPTIGTATAGNTTATVTYTAPVSNGGSTIIDYTITSNPGNISTTTSNPTTAIVTGLTNGTPYTFTVTARNAVGISASSSASNSITPVDNDAPVLSGIASTVSTSSVNISWTTDELASTLVEYGLTSSYGYLTAETNTAPRVLSHSVTIPSLVACTTYHYRVKSNDTLSNLATGSDNTFTTTGCTGGAAVTGQNQASITSGLGGTVNLTSGPTGLSLNIPTGATGADAVYQIKSLNQATAFVASGTPSGVLTVGNYAFDLKSLTGVGTAVTSFLQPIIITLTYQDSDVVGINESSLVIYRWNGATWSPLTGCSVNTGLNTVTCTTTNFSVFGLFGTAPVVVSSGGGVVLLISQITPTLPNPVITQTPSVSFTRDLKLGMTGKDVKKLQHYLNTHGFVVASSGVGSPGKETNTFGPATRSALKKFQKANSLKPDGILGPKTREVINRLLKS